MGTKARWMIHGEGHVISGPPKVRMSAGTLWMHGLIQTFVYLSVPFAVILSIPKLREIREGGNPRFE